MAQKPATDNPFSTIPSVSEIVDASPLAPWRERLPHALVVESIRVVLDRCRYRMAKEDGKYEVPEHDDLAHEVCAELELSQIPPLQSVINATGIIIHTGLGRAPLPEQAVDALADVALNYAPVELDMHSGERGKRVDVVRDLLCEITEAESATVVNNTAAALLITLATIADGKSVAVSRGELIEIGGSFRLPEVMKAGGAILREVGTTNKTRLGDYESVIDDTMAAFLKVHPSNFRIEGFTDTPSIDELAALGHSVNIPVIHDVGSGVLYPHEGLGLDDEPDVRTSIRSGADLVLFSGDKLLGGPQAGIIVGNKELVDRIERHSMMRALRVDKLVLASLAVTLQLHRDPDLARQSVPVLSMLATSERELHDRAKHFVARLEQLENIEDAEILEVEAFLGGGSMPAKEIKSVAVAITPTSGSESELAIRLRQGTGSEKRVIARIHGGRVLFDLRTVFSAQEDALISAIQAATD